MAKPHVRQTPSARRSRRRGRAARAARAIAAAIILATASLPASALTPARASAHTVEPCRQASPVVNVVYGAGVTGPYATAAVNAAKSWNRSGAGVTFRESPSHATVGVYAVNFGNTGYDGITHYTCYGADYMVAYSYFNTYYTDRYDQLGKQQIMAHELGHALGLGEMGGYYCSTLPVMYYTSDRYFSCGVYTPKADDVNGVRSLYGTSGPGITISYGSAVRASRPAEYDSLSSLSEAAHLVATVTATGRHRVDYVGAIPFTISTVTVDGVLAGRAPSRTIEIRQAGRPELGSGGIVEPGKSYVVYLDPYMLHPGVVVDPAEFVVVGGSSGMFRASGPALSRVDPLSTKLPAHPTLRQVTADARSAEGLLPGLLRRLARATVG